MLAAKSKSTRFLPKPERVHSTIFSTFADKENHDINNTNISMVNSAKSNNTEQERKRKAGISSLEPVVSNPVIDDSSREDGNNYPNDTTCDQQAQPLSCARKKKKLDHSNPFRAALEYQRIKLHDSEEKAKRKVIKAYKHFEKIQHRLNNINNWLDEEQQGGNTQATAVSGNENTDESSYSTVLTTDVEDRNDDGDKYDHRAQRRQGNQTNLEHHLPRRLFDNDFFVATTTSPPEQTAMFLFPPVITSHLQSLEHSLNNKTVMPKIFALVKSWIVLKEQETTENEEFIPLDPIFFDAAYCETHDKDMQKIARALAMILYYLGIHKSCHFVYSNRNSRRSLYETIELAKGGVLYIDGILDDHMFPVLQQILKMSDYKDTLLICSDIFQNLNWFKENRPTSFQTLCSWNIVSIHEQTKPIFVTKFEQIVHSNGFVADFEVYYFVGTLYQTGKIHHYCNSHNDDASLQQQAQDYWRFVKLAWLQRKYNNPFVDKRITLGDVSLATYNATFIFNGGM